MPYYFDHNATTPVDPLVLTAFTAAAGEVCGNASSIHYFGQKAKQRLESARGGVARLVGASPREIVFTSGGTESDNLAIFGAVRASSKPRKHVVTTAIEHSAVLAACAQLANEDVAVTLVPVGSSGVVDPDDIRRAILPGTVLISVMHANNETGAIQPLAEISAIAREAGVLLHSDGVQGAARLAVNVNEPRVDLYSFSAHKMNGLKGTGALFVREKTPFQAALFGGHQERERRPGTENVPGAVAFAAAAGLPRTDMSALRDRLEQGIREQVPSARVNAAGSPRLPNTSNIRFPGLTGEGLVIALDLDGFAVSSGSACSSGSIEAPHVLLAMGLTEEEARASVRFSLGAGNTIEQVDGLIEAVGRVAARSRRWELAHV
jgi:cysteine desulfurase